MSAKSTSPFTGIWRCAYWAPSNEFIGDELSEYRMQVVKKGDDLVFESLPNEDQSYMFVRLKLDGDVATGTWSEVTALHGQYAGAHYSGAGQLMVNLKTGAMEGKWAGAGFDHKLNAMRIYSGNWEMNRIADE